MKVGRCQLIEPYIIKNHHLMAIKTHCDDTTTRSPTFAFSSKGFVTPIEYFSRFTATAVEID